MDMQKKNPKISIIIPAYNVEDYIGRCLDSCIEQTLYDIEIICVDDESQDATTRIIDAYAKRDSRIVAIHKKKGGVSAARNEGIKMATGSWLIFLDSDDILCKETCEEIWIQTLCNDCELIVHGAEIVSGDVKPEYWVTKAVSTRNAFYRDFNFDVINENGATPFLWLHAYSRKLIDRAGIRFNEKISLGEDIVFQMMIIPCAKGILFISRKLYFYTYNRNGSLMEKSTADYDLKIERHIDNLTIIADYWEKEKLLDRYGNQFLEWVLAFLMPDIETRKLKKQEEHAKRIEELIKKCNLNKYEKSINYVAARQYKKLMAICAKRSSSI